MEHYMQCELKYVVVEERPFILLVKSENKTKWFILSHTSKKTISTMKGRLQFQTVQWDNHHRMGHLRHVTHFSTESVSVVQKVKTHTHAVHSFTETFRQEAALDTVISIYIHKEPIHTHLGYIHIKNRFHYVIIKVQRNKCQ